MTTLREALSARTLALASAANARQGRTTGRRKLDDVGRAARAVLLPGLDAAWRHSLRTGGEQDEREYIEELHFGLANRLAEPEERIGMGVNINDVYHGDSLKAEDLRGQQARLTVAEIRVEEFEDKGIKKRKLVLGFQGTERTMVLNVTNARMIAEMYGEDTDYWVGRQIVIAPEKTEFQGRIVDAIRVKYVQPAQPQQAAPLANAGQAPLPDPGLPNEAQRPIGGQSAGLPGEQPAGGQPWADDDPPIPFAPCR